jgi:hypothetical protein
MVQILLRLAGYWHSATILLGVVRKERLFNKTTDDFCVNIATKTASHTLRLLLRRRFGIDVLTFQSQPI